MSELTDKVEELIGGVFGNNHELKAVAEPFLVELVKKGEAILTKEHLSEIKMRRAQADLDTLIGACEKFLELVSPDNFSWGPKETPEAPAEPAAEETAPAAEAPAEEA